MADRSLRILAEGVPGDMRVALVEDGQLAGLSVDVKNRPPMAGGIWMGQVLRAARSLDALLVRLPDGGEAVLPRKSIRPQPEGDTALASALPAGERVMVQLVSEAAPDGEAKRPVVSMDTGLRGCYLILTPLSPQIAISRRVARGRARDRLAAFLGEQLEGTHMGVIARHTSVDADPGMLAQEISWAADQWAALCRRAGDSTSHDTAILAPPDALLRMLMDYGWRQPAEMQVSAGLIEQARDAVRAMPPGLAPVPAIAGNDGLSPFEFQDIAGQLARLGGPRIDLGGGASIIIRQTEALTVVDVNAGPSGHHAEVNALAARMLARVLRIMNIGGMVVVDFIGTSRPAIARKALEALSDAVADDPARVDIYGLTAMGLVELVRERRGASVDPAMLAEQSRERN